MELIGDEFLVGNFDFGELGLGGGKGGDIMVWMCDGRYFIKMLSEGDGKSLFEDVFLKDYVAWVTMG